MKILVFLFVISNINLILANENSPIEKGVTHQDTYKVHSDAESIHLEHDQVAESSHSIIQTRGSQRSEVPDGNPSPVQRPVHDDRNVQQAVHLPENLRFNTAESNIEVSEPVLNQYNQVQPIYVQQYSLQPIRIFGAEASPYHQVQETEAEKPLGFSSYVEHVSEKDEEINSAIKEGSVDDIKRLVPKSEISFKIYPNEKNVNLENQKTETKSSAVTYIHSKAPNNSRQKYRIKPEAATKIHASYTQHQRPLTNAGEQQNVLENYHNLQQVAGTNSHSQDNIQNLYYTQPVVNSLLDANKKNLLSDQPHFKLKVKDNNYNKGAPATILNSFSTHDNNVQYKHEWDFTSKTEDLQNSYKNVKPISEEQHEIDPVAQGERTRGLHFSLNHVVQNNFNKFKTSNNLAEHAKNNANYFHSNPYSAKENQNGQLAAKAYAENKLVNRLNGNYIKDESLNTGQNPIINLGTSAYGESQAYKTGQGQQFATNSLFDSETAKSDQHNLISHVAKNLVVEAKSGQNNFDHQKALEGSTSFDIKNAIDNGNFIHQNSVTQATDVHHIKDLQKQQIAYVIPKIPTSTVFVNSAVQEAPVFGGQHIKELGIPSPHIPYHVFSSPEANSKFLHEPAILLPSQHLRQGNSLTVSDLHQPLVKLHLPNEEIHQHVKVPNLEFPTSGVSHISYQEQKQPYVLHYDIPSVKYPSEFVFQPKSKTRVQNTQATHIKLGQPLIMDWSLFKSTFPNFNFNSFGVKPEIFLAQESGKKIVPILVRKRKNRSNNKQEIGIIYGKVSGNRRPTKPNKRHEKTVRQNLHPEANNNVKQYETKGERKNEFSVSASYKVDRSFKIPSNS